MYIDILNNCETLITRVCRGKFFITKVYGSEGFSRVYRHSLADRLFSLVCGDWNELHTVLNPHTRLGQKPKAHEASFFSYTSFLHEFVNYCFSRRLVPLLFFLVPLNLSFLLFRWAIEPFFFSSLYSIERIMKIEFDRKIILIFI